MVVQAPLSARPVGFVMAGGRSTRMGRDKALLPWDGRTLLDHAIARLAAVCDDVRILCGPAPRYGGHGRSVVVDAIPDGGPLAGLAAGLASAGSAPGLFLGVDLPRVPVELLAALAGLGDGARPGADGAGIGAGGDRPGADVDAVVPVTPEGAEPLCALYHPRCLPAVRARLAKGDFRMTSFWPDVRVRTLEGPALAAFGDPRRIFHNLNAPSDHPDLAGGGA